MISLSENLTLYHASYTKVETVDLSRCRNKNDFGKGIYLTTSREQAERFVKTSIAKSGRTVDSGYINMYSYRGFGGLNLMEFVTADEAWLNCICAFRQFDIASNDISRWEAYDTIIGKIANDDTMTAITIYLSGGYGEYGSAEAVSAAIRVLRPDRLKDQICLKTETAISRLHFLEAYEVELK
jgi:hypothetical protein